MANYYAQVKFWILYAASHVIYQLSTVAYKVCIVLDDASLWLLESARRSTQHERR